MFKKADSTNPFDDLFDKWTFERDIPVLFLDEENPVWRNA